MIVVLALLVAPIATAALFWGSWGWTAAALRRSQRFSARVWRSTPTGRRGDRERATESVYVLVVLAGLVLLVMAISRVR